MHRLLHYCFACDEDDLTWSVDWLYWHYDLHITVAQTCFDSFPFSFFFSVNFSLVCHDHHQDHQITLPLFDLALEHTDSCWPYGFTLPLFLLHVSLTTNLWITKFMLVARFTVALWLVHYICFWFNALVRLIFYFFSTILIFDIIRLISPKYSTSVLVFGVILETRDMWGDDFLFTPFSLKYFICIFPFLCMCTRVFFFVLYDRFTWRRGLYRDGPHLFSIVSLSRVLLICL